MEFVHTISNASEKSTEPEGDTHSHTISNIESDYDGVYLSRPATAVREEGSLDYPAEIPPYFEADVGGSNAEGDDDEVEDDSYEYDSDDDAQFSGFLVRNPSLVATVQHAVVTEEPGCSSSPATIRDEEEQQPDGEPVVVEPASTATVAITNSKWRQPSQEAVNMSLRAEQEKNGGKRRLAQDLYRIMNQDTQEAGFSLEPAEEDCMNKWTIKLFQFDEDSNLAKDMLVLGIDNIQLEMSFPEQYPFEPPFVRVVKPRFKRQTGFVMNGALCMELLTKDGWSPINDIESVIVSIRSQIPVGDGRLEAAVNLPEEKYNSLLKAARSVKRAAAAFSSPAEEESHPANKRQRRESNSESATDSSILPTLPENQSLVEQQRRLVRDEGGAYSVSEAKVAFSHLSDYHKKKGWDASGWWARKG